MKTLGLAVILLLTSGIFAQTDTILSKKWRLKAIYGFNGTQTQFVNWNAGGRNNISVLGFIQSSANYKFQRMKWDNEFNIALGGLQYLDANQAAGTNSMFQKTDDRIEYSSNVGYGLTDVLNLSIVAGFRTQMLEGFNYPNDSIRTSKFMAPGYFNAGIGLDYSPSNNFTLFASPLAAKVTVVDDETLANAGSFGVEAAQYDDLEVLIVPGQRVRYEVGSYLKASFAKAVAKNIELKSKIELFSNYLDKPQNIDVNAEVLWSFKVNSWFQASLQWNLIYDDDIQISDGNGNIGPRTQFKSVLGLGVSYTMKNFTK